MWAGPRGISCVSVDTSSILSSWTGFMIDCVHVLICCIFISYSEIGQEVAQGFEILLQRARWKLRIPLVNMLQFFLLPGRPPPVVKHHKWTLSSRIHIDGSAKWRRIVSREAWLSRFAMLIWTRRAILEYDILEEGVLKSIYSRNALWSEGARHVLPYFNNEWLLSILIHASLLKSNEVNS